MNNTWSQEHPDFLPDYSPIEMFKLGIMGGNYFDPTVGDWTEFTPQEFADELKSSLEVEMYASGFYNRKLNAFGVRSGLTYEEWMANGWIKPQDPFGWVNWYVNFYYGRRSDDDLRQIRRWVSFKPRHTATLLRTGSPENLKHGHRTRQNLLHWGIDSTKVLRVPGSEEPPAKLPPASSTLF